MLHNRSKRHYANSLSQPQTKAPWLAYDQATVPSCIIQNDYLKMFKVIDRLLSVSPCTVDPCNVQSIDLEILLFPGAFHSSQKKFKQKLKDKTLKQNGNQKIKKQNSKSKNSPKKQNKTCYITTTCYLQFKVDNKRYFKMFHGSCCFFDLFYYRDSFIITVI